MSNPSPGQVRDPESGIFRKDIKLIHVKILPTCSDSDYAILEERLRSARLEGLDSQYVVIVTRDVDMIMDTVENYIAKLNREKEAFKNPTIIDALIVSLRSIRSKIWGKDEREKELQKAPSYTNPY